MNKSTDNLPILAVLIAGIGDLVLASPALLALKKGHPHTPLHLLTSREASELAVNYPFLDKVWPFPIRQLRRNKSVYLEIFLLLMRLLRTRFQQIVNLYHVDSLLGALKMVTFLSMLRSEMKIGHNRYGMGLFLHKKLPGTFYSQRHLAEAMMEIAGLAGGKADNSGTEVFWNREAEARCGNIFTGVLSSSPMKRDELKVFIGINPGGDRANRRWPAERYAAVANMLADSMPARILILGGPGEEHIASKIVRQMSIEGVNLAGKISINDLAYVISRLDLLITNDSGPMHIAAATRTPVVAIFGPEDPILMRPYTSEDLYRIIYKPLPCRPCQKDVCRYPLCLEAITPEQAFKAAMELLEKLSNHRMSKIRPHSFAP